MSNEIAVVPSQQVATTPQRSLASRMFPNSGHTDVEPVKVGHPLAQSVAAERADYEDTIARLAPQHIKMAQDTFARFGSEPLKKVVLERGWGSEPQTVGFVAQLGYHIAALEKHNLALEQEIASLKRNRR